VLYTLGLFLNNPIGRATDRDTHPSHPHIHRVAEFDNARTGFYGLGLEKQQD
jgi:hypothetical protein